MPRLAALLTCLLTACSSGVADFGTGEAPPEGLTIEVLGMRAAEGGYDVELEIRNDSKHPFIYRGYSTEQPVFAYEYLTERAWVRPVYVMCGTGLQSVGLDPGQRVRTVARVYGRNHLQRLRVGIDEYIGGFTLWSPVINPATQKAGRHPS